MPLYYCCFFTSLRQRGERGEGEAQQEEADHQGGGPRKEGQHQDTHVVKVSYN